MPEDEDDDEPSEHLSSRLEVEQVLQATGISVSTLRCGMIVGPVDSRKYSSTLTVVCR